MRKINLRDVPVTEWKSPAGTFHTRDQEISLALGRVPGSDRKSESHPFDLEIVTIPPGKVLCPYHAHSVQWELYLVIQGTGKARHEGGMEPIGPGDAFIFGPGEAHTIYNDGSVDLVYYLVADDPPGDSCYYPDSQKWMLEVGKYRGPIRGANVDYFDGEEIAPPPASAND